ncbi:MULTISPECIES: TetR/AcrR family transcriptional regulator [Curtobacterium]|uniref:TetR/AcrR family transcriptional regulator n=1 Tax=Curtobacterium TaxID=2034 RepID=UPI000DA6F987|nr:MULTISPECIES: TetR-like C-terminal domain-containing protein [unclassified Curtobacterium]PZE67156.1 TetR/AcrR family transcriptional regulator [Curtobacterium sp. MCLR17_059]PZF00283.1 TetR/AcrR family transcriptional regulator [Curtobacterium sp. MCLR17_040]PZF26321.1 TetR/AcrR family transcriptional regulator [Curtobacterium sp. MCLR17_045]PZF50597.1 TetR/AcrR family transcriptional regulator [Curtobacterium sp. MCLR17_057]WIB44250.1 WHG domain-containing protein [Curtobacterium sp. MCLR
MPRAGLDPATVTEAAATLADEIGLAQLSMSLVADRLGVKAPSLYKHVDGLGDLTRRIAILGANELGDALRDAMQGRSGRSALEAAVQTVRRSVQEHPARYQAAVGVRPTGADDPLAVALGRTLASFAAALRDYPLDPADEVHALRVLRSVLHGFATIEASGGFQMDTDVDASAAWMVDFLDRGFRAATTR